MLAVLAAAVTLLTQGCVPRMNAQNQHGSGTAHSYVPDNGFVPTAQVAVEIARARLTPIYGRERIEGQLPLTARLEGDWWVVEGTLPPGRVGGVAHAEITRADGRILRVTHGR
jgi:NTF2 fold immunity protein